MLLDGLFIAVFRWGIAGAAIATAISQILGGIVPLFYFFSKKNSSLLRLTTTKLDVKSLLYACANGSSEFMINVSLALVGMIFNAQLLRYAEGTNGLSAYGVLMYVGFVFVSIFLGYSIGTAPIIGFHYGAKNKKELRSLLLKSACLVGVASLSMFLLSELLASPISHIFVGKHSEEVLELTKRAFLLYSFSFLFCGFSIFTSSFFTALGNGPISALISFSRTLFFQVLAVFLLPLITTVPTDGIWLAVPIAEACALTVTGLCLFLFRKRYGYGRQ